MKRERIRVEILLDQSRKDALTIVADKIGISISELGRRLIDTFLDDYLEKEMKKEQLLLTIKDM